ncbi:protein of unknown function [Desulfurobacterium pacificum]|uniref:Card1 endonuclease domain-containing protein n=1 Tax=Desulfurobacterium pacificum TaxID=240166 RepID=A0ABY1NAU8_9BACT|nr:DUF1887 family CARF protein [Desulfurobacterium pacificum]SMP05129.1 protein of unknown function [Desulfurobacterium pacificum]
MNRTFKVMVSPVSTQVFPVVVTALTIRPERVVLLTTPKVEIFTKLIKRALLFAGIEVEERNINPYSFNSIKEKTKDLQNPFLLLNCGTKFTAIALFRLFGEENAYYYTPEGKIIDFNSNLLEKVSQKLVDVELHSQMYGFEIVEERQDHEKIRMREKLTRYIASKPSLLPVLTKLYLKGSARILPNEFAGLAKKFEVVVYRGGKYVVLDREYIGGKWLEEFTFLELLKKNFYDVRIGVKVEWYEKGVINEIDVMATKHNQLHIFSCKTGKNVKEIAKHLYELEELTERIGGDFGKSFLVITENIYVKSPPRREDFPNAPSVPYKVAPSTWNEYYKTEEGQRFKKLFRIYNSFKYLHKRASLLGIEILTPEILKRNLGGRSGA